jgi:hypothetical protein
MKMEGASPARLLEMLSDRFGAFEAIAYSTIKLARHVPEDDLSMDVLVAEAMLEFGSDLREACKVIRAGRISRDICTQRSCEPNERNLPTT